MSDSENLKQIIGNSARDMILKDYGLPLKDINKCWLHNDNTPSMSWDSDLLTFKCFGCHETYDIFDHYQQFMGMSFPEALESLAGDCGYQLKDEYKPSKLKKKARVLVTKEYNDKMSSFRYEQESWKSYIENQMLPNLNPDNLAIYDLKGTDLEILFFHKELVSNELVTCFTKRRKLDGSLYQMESSTPKEISVAGGQQCFFGQQTLFNLKGEFKSHVIITEGHKDCLVAYHECVLLGIHDTYGVLSLPNGSQSLKTAIQDSPLFRRWAKKASSIILIPDYDQAGKALVDGAKDLLPAEKTFWCDLGKLSDKLDKGTDIEELIAAGESLETILELQEPIPIDQCISLRDISVKNVEHGIDSGFATHDWNDSGLKMGNVTLVTGFRGNGKSTLVRQILASVAMQGFKSFCWFGEGSMEEEKSRFIRACARRGKIVSYQNRVGRTLFKPDSEMEADFNQHLADFFTFYQMPHDPTIDPFDNLMQKMRHYAKLGHKVFSIDNLMVLTAGYGSNELSMQKKIIAVLKDFALKYQVHVILIAHPKKGEGNQSVSGSGNIENTVDTLLRYIRVSGDAARTIAASTDIPDIETQFITAVVLNEKVRNEGESNPMFLEWDSERGVCRDIAYIDNLLPVAEEYFRKSWFSRPCKEVYL